MILEFLSITDFIILDSILLLTILFFMFKWFVKEVREISEKPKGFIKFCQITFILCSWGSFIALLVYYIIKPDNNVNILNIFLTIIVGFLGTMLGLFFSEKALEEIKLVSNHKSEILNENQKFLEDLALLLEEKKEQKK